MKDITIPVRMQGLRRDSKRRVVPFFVQEPEEGQEPDFRIMDGRKILRCIQDNLCWLCGQKLGIHKAFVLGPMCAVNRVNAEPPSHYECAHYAVQVCPFLTTPRMTRREGDYGEGELREPAGLAIYRNPGAAAVWVTRSYRAIPDGMGGIMLRLGEPERVEWYCEGREATRAEILASIDSGFPILEKYALEDGPDAVKQLATQYEATMKLLPAA